MTQHIRDPRKNPGIKRSYLALPDTLEGTASYCVTIPAGLSNKIVLIDLLTIATQWFNWQRSIGTEGKQAADAWRDALNLPELEECMACCPEPTNQRYNEVGILEVSYDGGLTWEERRDLDPRFNAPLMPPLTGAPGDAKRCLAANNASGYIKSMADQLIADGTAWNSITALLAAIGAIILILLSIGSGGALTPLLLGLVAALVGTGLAAFDAAMTETVYGDLNCILYCHSDDDGVYTEAAWQAIKADILAQFDGIVEKFLYDSVNAMGLAGLNNAARAGVSSGEPCDDCQCEGDCGHQYDIIPPFTSPGHGTITGRTANSITGTLGNPGNNNGYFIIGSEVLGDCCWVAAISGGGFAAAFIPCGVAYSNENWTNATPIGQCCQYIQVQGVVGASVTITFDVCPP